MTSKTDVLIYTLDYCPYCMKAKIFFSEHNIEYKEISCENDEENYRKKLTQEYNLPSLATFPQIIINGQNIGGYSDLIDKFARGEITFN